MATGLVHELLDVRFASAAVTSVFDHPCVYNAGPDCILLPEMKNLPQSFSFGSFFDLGIDLSNLCNIASEL